MILKSNLFYFTFLKILLIFREEGEGGRKMEKNIDVQEIQDWLPLTCPQLGTQPATQVHPDWESNWQPFGSQTVVTQSTEPHQPGLKSNIF